MKLYLFRHGAAVDIGEHGVTSDKDRMLSADGRKRAAMAVRGIKRIADVPRRIYASPLIRARETAEIAVRELELRGEAEIMEELGVSAPMDRILTRLAPLTETPVMLVGHMPGLAELASVLISGDFRADIRIGKAALAVVSFENAVEAGAGTLECLVQSKALRTIGKLSDNG